MKNWNRLKRKKALLLGAVALALAAVVAVCFCCVRVETPAQRERRLSSQLSSSLSSPLSQSEDSLTSSQQVQPVSGQEEESSSQTGLGETSQSSPPTSSRQEEASSPAENPSQSASSSLEESPPASTPSASQPETPVGCTVTLTIDASRYQASGAQPGRVLVEQAKWEFTGSATVWDAFQGVCQAYGIEYRSTSDLYGVYIREIQGMREGDCGSTSGWVYYLNGQFAHLGVSSQPLKDGDHIRFAYSVLPHDTDGEG